MLVSGILLMISDSANLFDEEVQISGDMTADAGNQYSYYEVGRLFKVGYEFSF